MTWDTFPLYAGLSIGLSLAGSCFALFNKKRSVAAILTVTVACGVLLLFISGLWMNLQRPPMRTMGETRLWYSFFVMGAGLCVYLMWKFRWILLLTGILSSVFSIINILRPEIHDMTLMPALQSAWFIPHVTIYMLAYSILACATLLAVLSWIRKDDTYLPNIDNLIYIGTGMVFLGLLSGSIWAKSAWGDYWGWDPKETWAAITCAGYLAYIHLRFTKWAKSRWMFALVIVSFILLQMCWYGYQYLPSSESSMHMYNISQ